MEKEPVGRSNGPYEHSEGGRELSVHAVGMDAVVIMAAFMKDFKPAQIFVGQQAGAYRVLNPMWVSGLVGEAVRRWCGGCVVHRLRIEHITEGFEGDALRARVDADGTSGQASGGTIRLRVVNAKGRVLATAVAEVVPGDTVNERPQTE